MLGSVVLAARGNAPGDAPIITTFSGVEAPAIFRFDHKGGVGGEQGISWIN